MNYFSGKHEKEVFLMLFYGIPPQSSSKLLKIENSFPNSPEFLRKLLCLENSPQISSNLLLLSKKKFSDMSFGCANFLVVLAVSILTALFLLSVLPYFNGFFCHILSFYCFLFSNILNFDLFCYVSRTECKI